MNLTHDIVRRSARQLCAVLLASIAACAGYSRASLHPIPDLAVDSVASDMRGSADAARAISEPQQIEIAREVVRSFFRPTRGQARWIDSRILAHRRSGAADSAASADDDWADAIVQAVGLQRVCTLDADAECRGRPGAVLTFSSAYLIRPDTAIIFTRITTIGARAPAIPARGFEMEFHLARTDGGWRIVAKRTIVDRRSEDPASSARLRP